MKKVLITLAVGVLSAPLYASAQPLIDTSWLNSLDVSSCWEVSEQTIYWDETYLPYSTFTPDDFKRIRAVDYASKVDMYSPDNKILLPEDNTSGFSWTSEWFDVSTYFPQVWRAYYSEIYWGLNPVRNNFSVLQPSDRDKVLWIIKFTHYTRPHYEEALPGTTEMSLYKWLWNRDPKTFQYRASCWENEPKPCRYTIYESWSTLFRTRLDPDVSTSCLVYKPRWCWDGVIDADKWEQCDWWENCTSSCRIDNWWNPPEDREYCWDGIAQAPNDDNFYEECDWGSNCNADCTEKDDTVWSCTWPDCNWWGSCTWPDCNWGGSCTGDNCDPDTPVTPPVPPKICGDWNIDTPNDAWLQEQCDNSSSWCNACQIQYSNIWTSLDIEPSWDVTLWFLEKVFLKSGEPKEISITNTSEYPMRIDRNICIREWWESSDTSGHKLTWDGWNIEQCFTIWTVLPWSSKSYSISDYTAKRLEWDDINRRIWDTKLVTYISWNSWVSKDYNVKIVAPSVMNTGWWTVYWDFNSFLTDINSISTEVWWYDEANSNFVSTHIWERTFSSHLESTSDSEKAEDARNVYNSDIPSNLLSSSYWSQIDIEDMQRYNWMSNVYFYTWDVLVNGFQDNITEWKTYIINWNLTITDNIDFDNSKWQVLFFVWGDIIVSNNVTNLDWFYISEWEMTASPRDYSTNLLEINGALYWDSTDLLRFRTNISEFSWVIRTWTVVNFNSSIYTNPPPLFWEIISWKIKMEKFAKEGF